MPGVRAVLLAALASAALSGCVPLGPGAQQPSLDTASLLGTWVSSDGASITFSGADSFAATRFNYANVIPTCGVMSGTGTYQFIGPDGRSVASSGPGTTMIGLFLDDDASTTGQCTSAAFELTAWDVGSKAGLCVQVDPDTPCDGYIFTKQ
jgi:hypothetical protein